jgi:hypothetical protein
MKTTKAVLSVFVLLAITALSYATPPDQPFMQAARTELQKAKASLQRASANKGGHRVNAMGYINSAIAEVNLGIQYDRRHHHAVRAANPDQPFMEAALDHLRAAKNNLESETTDKGGHRKKAIGYINKAIDEVKKGIEAAS